MRFCETVEKLLGYARQKLLLNERDVAYVRNRMLEIVGADGFSETDAHYEGERLETLLEQLTQEGERLGYFSEEDREKIQDGVMNALMLPPSGVEREFYKRMERDGKLAMDWLYEYSVDCDYVKKEKLDQNPRFTADNGLIVTINLAKPEFRDAKKAASGNSVRGGYPKCTICRSNEGFGGRNKRTLRTVSLTLGGEKWFWQYSPYGYFYQHGIAVNETHTPMHVGRDTFERLMDFVDLFPHYFIGCNAPLPRIGGSVLAHDHFQGGGERLPIMNVPDAAVLEHGEGKDALVSVLDWPGTAVKIVSKNRKTVAALAETVRKGWVNYRNDSLGIVPADDDGVHSAVSPTVVRTERGYEMILILRSNITSGQYPDGVFHAHPEFHFIKKESIGLIEAQGLFILPGRLKEQLSEIAKTLTTGESLPEELSDFALLFEEIKVKHPVLTAEQAEGAIKEELADICYRILQNTAVFGTHKETVRFLEELGFYEKRV